LVSIEVRSVASRFRRAVILSNTRFVGNRQPRGLRGLEHARIFVPLAAMREGKAFDDEDHHASRSKMLRSIPSSFWSSLLIFSVVMATACSARETVRADAPRGVHGAISPTQVCAGICLDDPVHAIPARNMLIDAWIQHPTATFMRHPMFESLRRWMGAVEIPDQIPLEFTLGALQAANVDRALVSAWYGPEGALISNDEVASYVKQAPELLVGVASVNLARPMDAVRELRRAVKQLGMRALRMLPWLWNLPPNDRRYYPLYAECIELGIPFCLQVGHTGPMRPSEPGRPIPYLDEVALDFPELVIVGGHIGYPWTDEMISLTTKYPNVYIDTSAYKIKRYPAQLREYIKGHGRKKVLFGSNYPMVTPLDCLGGLDEWGLDDEARRLFLGGNAARVFKLE